MSDYICEVLAKATVIVPLFLAYLWLQRPKKETPKPPDMTKTEYEDALALCISWIEINPNL